MRFNDYQRRVGAVLKLDDDQRRTLRPMMLKCFAKRLSMNACLALVKLELAKDQPSVSEETPPQVA
jgi:hypothetical protein